MCGKYLQIDYNMNIIRGKVQKVRAAGKRGGLLLKKQIICGVLACFLALSALCGSAQAAPPNSASSIISTALSQLDYEEGTRGYSKYGQWYGIPNGDWCDMFVSWCADEAGIPASVFPRSAGCTAHVGLFSQNSPYYVSAARGGTYIPQQGDIIFFYNYLEYPGANVVRHVGIVLCVENGYVFTIEGNTLTYRLDYPYFDTAFPLRDFALEPQDYVAVKCYPLDEPQIHGYAVPNYSDRSIFEHNGWIDLGRYESLRGTFDALAAQDIMAGTSSYTFSPRYGMTRGEFTAAVMGLYGLYGWEAGTEPFEDVLETNAYYGAVMTARSAGIVRGSDSGKFSPDIYISGADAQTIISRTLDYVGLKNRIFDFSEGDFSYMLTPYTIRADIAKALYALLSEMPTPAVSSDRIIFKNEFLSWPMLKIDNSNYVPMEMLLQIFPTLTIDSDPDSRQPVPMKYANRVFLSSTRLYNRNGFADVPSFYYQGVQYVMLRPAADLFSMEVRWNGESQTIELF